MENKLFSFVTILCVCALFGQIQSSAIPMWEFLSKEEKMSYLYSMFANQVDDFCTTVSVNNCNKELLKYGLNKLKDMPEDHLDTMDPYQRGANNIIWDSMMEGHEMIKTTPKPRLTTTAKPNSFEDESFGDLGGFGAQTAASAKIDNIYRVPPPKDFVITFETGTPQYTYPHNVVPYLNTFHKINKNSNGGVYNRFQQQYTTQRVPVRNYEDVPLTGPMVVKVYPDGTPVRDDAAQSLPHDEDLRQYKLSKVQIPNL